MKRFIATIPVAAALVGCGNTTEAPKRPNVIVILADDLGLGDVGAYGAQAIKTPNLDFLAQNGVQFTNGYATSATSTPSRYALMTGMYPWKNANAKILAGDAPLLVGVDQYTLPKYMQKAGYRTAAIGKWHLGMGDGNVNWNETVIPGAREIGFDYSCLIAATNDRVPTVFVENGDVVGLDKNDPIEVSYKKNFEGEPTALTNPEMLKMKWHHGHNNSIVNGIPRIGFMKGGESARWVDENMADYFLDKVKTYINEESDEPFFLYYGLHQPHVPRTPNQRFVGSTNLGPRGDAVVEGDWCVGELIAELKAKGLLENTLIIFSSDNGPVLNDGYYDEADEHVADHDQRGGTRGGKYSLFDGGTHVPFMVYWEGHIQPLKSDAIFCQMDIFASLAELVGEPLEENIDSQEMLDVMLGKSTEGRTNLVQEANGKMAIRSGDYQMIPPYSGPKVNTTLNETGNSETYALYNLKEDRGQKNEISKENPEILERLKAEFLEITKGYYDANAAEIELK